MDPILQLLLGDPLLSSQHRQLIYVLQMSSCTGRFRSIISPKLWPLCWSSHLFDLQRFNAVEAYVLGPRTWGPTFSVIIHTHFARLADSHTDLLSKLYLVIMAPNYKFAGIHWIFNIATMLNTTTFTPNTKFPIEGDRTYHYPCSPPADVRHVGRQASAGHDYNRPYPSSDDNTMTFAIVRNFWP